MRRSVLSLCMGLLAACSSKQAQPPQSAPEVGVVTLRQQAVSLTTELPGRTVAYRIADVRPQVSGVIMKRLFVEGADVKAGQQLYQIDPAPFQASLESAQAALARAQANAVSTKLLAERYKPLSEARAVSAQDYDNAVASQAQAAADVASAKASVDTARINLAYTRVYSPISGRSGRSSVTEGALVTASQTVAMVTVQQLDPIYVDVTQPSAIMLRLQRELANGRLKKVGDNQAQSHLVLEDGSHYDQDGKLQFAETTVDQGTGSVTLRAVYPNEKRILLPGMFVHERIEEGVDEKGLLVPQQAITHNQRGDATALLVGPDNMASTRVISTDRAIGDKWLVSGGLAAGDKVVLVGLQRIRGGGGAVNPHEVSPDHPDPDAAAAPDAAPPKAPQKQ